MLVKEAAVVDAEAAAAEPAAVDGDAEVLVLGRLAANPVTALVPGSDGAALFLTMR